MEEGSRARAETAASRQCWRWMSVLFLYRVCRLWKMLVERSALWRHVPDTVQGMYRLYLENAWRGGEFLHKTRLGLFRGCIYHGSVELWYRSRATLSFKLKTVDFSPLIIRMFGCCRERSLLWGISSGETCYEDFSPLVWDAPDLRHKWFWNHSTFN